MQLKHKPYHLLIPTAILLCAGGMLSFNMLIDVMLYDTYYVFPLSFLCWVPAVILLFFWTLYLVANRFLFSRKLVWIHVVSTVVASLLLLVLPYITTYSSGGVGASRRYFDYGVLNNFKVLGNLTGIAVTVFAFLLLAQLVYFINLFVGLYKKVGRNGASI